MKAAAVNVVALVAKTLGVVVVLLEEEAESSIEHVAAVVNVVAVVAKTPGAVAMLQEEAEAKAKSSTS